MLCLAIVASVLGRHLRDAEGGEAVFIDCFIALEIFVFFSLLFPRILRDVVENSLVSHAISSCATQRKPRVVLHQDTAR